jgi:hypothetical protein
MSMRISLRSIAIFSAIFLSTSAQAATVTAERGDVLVNRGKGFVAVRQAIEVAPGDQVMARPKGIGRVSFADGCSLDVQPGRVFTVSEQSPCERRGSHIETGGSIKDGPVEEVRERRSLVPIIVGGAAVGVGILLLTHDKDKGASP